MTKLSMGDLESGPGNMIPARFQGQSFKEWALPVSTAQYERIKHHVKRLGLNNIGELWEAMPVYPIGRPALAVVPGGAPSGPRKRSIRHRTGKAVVPITATLSGEGEIPE
jgi:hypothetical protein